MCERINVRKCQSSRETFSESLDFESMCVVDMCVLLSLFNNSKLSNCHTWHFFLYLSVFDVCEKEKINVRKCQSSRETFSGF